MNTIKGRQGVGGYKVKPKRKPMNRKSKSRKLEDRIYAIVKARVLELIPVCVVCRKAQARDIHHVWGRVGWRWDKIPLLIDPYNFCPVCGNACHPKRMDDFRNSSEAYLLSKYHDEIMERLPRLPGAMQHSLEDLLKAVSSL